MDNVSIDAAVWNFMANSGTIDNGAGSVTGMEFLTFSGAGTDFTIATIDFTALASGSSLLDIEKHISLSIPDFSAGGLPLDVELLDGSVSVSAVPVPAAVWLFGSGLIALVGISKRQNKST